MLKDSRLPLLGAGIVLLIVAALLFHSTITGQFLSDDAFVPHGECIAWDSGLLEVYAISDTLIGLSYTVISLILGVLVYRARRQVPFDWVFIAFGGFIFFCGLTHFMDVITLWQPLYWIDGGAKVLTALASVATALALPPTLPKILALVARGRQAQEQRRQLIVVNQTLEAEIAGRARVEEELRAALEREQGLSEFRKQIVIRLSHEFRTPLTVIHTSSHLIEAYFDRMTAEQRGQHVENIHHEIDHLTHLLDDILTIGRMETDQFAFQPEPTNLPDLCQSAIDEVQFAHDEQHHLEFQNEGACGKFLFDRQLIRKAIMSLLINAVNYSPQGGHVVVELRCDDHAATISIADAGIGVPEADRAHIFDTFYRGKNVADISGTGLGLAIAKQAVERHGGSIALVDQPPPGSRFVITLPLLLP
jgi:signal transduction histidine kinase